MSCMREYNKVSVISGELSNASRARLSSPGNTKSARLMYPSLSLAASKAMNVSCCHSICTYHVLFSRSQFQVISLLGSKQIWLFVCKAMQKNTSACANTYQAG